MDLICRTCLKKNAVRFNIFDYLQHTRLISDVLMELTSIKISKEDGFPVNICDKCLEKLHTVYDFKQMVIESDRELLQSQHSKIMEAEMELKHVAPADVCLKDETEVVKCEELEFASCDDQNMTEDLVLSDCEGTSIKGEDMLEELNPSNEYDRLSITSQDKIECFDSNAKEKNTKKSKNKAIPVNKSRGKKSNISTKKKDSAKIEEQLKFIDNPDCRRIIESGLSRQEKIRATVFCEVCNRTMGYRYYIHSHVHVHTGNLPFKCEQCDVRFAKEYRLRKHMYMHSQKKEYTCEECGKAFALLHQLKAHKVVHSNERPYACSTCQKTFKCTISLQNHEVCHRSVKQFICEECGKSYSHKRALLNHQVTHSKDKKMVCPTCGKLFPHKTALNDHVKRHLEVRPYGCDTCSKRFTHKKLLDQHLLIHKGIKPYSCKICAKKFRQNGGLGRHMRIHTGETPYSCKLCATSFKYSYLLKSHMKKHDVEDIKDEEVKDSDMK